MELSENYIDGCNYRLISEDNIMKKVLVVIWQLSANKVRTHIVSKGESLKDACVQWEMMRNNNDDLMEVFKKSKFFNKPIEESYYDFMTCYQRFIDSLSGREMFDIMRDGQYHEVRYNFEGIIDIWLRKQNEYTLYQLYTDFLDYEEISYEYNQEFNFKDIIEDCDFIDFLSMKFEDSDFINDIIDELGIDN